MTSIICSLFVFLRILIALQFSSECLIGIQFLILSQLTIWIIYIFSCHSVIILKFTLKQLEWLFQWFFWFRPNFFITNIIRVWVTYSISCQVMLDTRGTFNNLDFTSDLIIGNLLLDIHTLIKLLHKDVLGYLQNMNLLFLIINNCFFPFFKSFVKNGIIIFPPS